MSVREIAVPLIRYLSSLKMEDVWKHGAPKVEGTGGRVTSDSIMRNRDIVANGLDLSFPDPFLKGTWWTGCVCLRVRRPQFRLRPRRAHTGLIWGRFHLAPPGYLAFANKTSRATRDQRP
jgi:hypothetical protein